MGLLTVGWGYLWLFWLLLWYFFSYCMPCSALTWKFVPNLIAFCYSILAWYPWDAFSFLKKKMAVNLGNRGCGCGKLNRGETAVRFCCMREDKIKRRKSRRKEYDLIWLLSQCIINPYTCTQKKEKNLDVIIQYILVMVRLPQVLWDPPRILLQYTFVLPLVNKQESKE